MLRELSMAAVIGGTVVMTVWLLRPAPPSVEAAPPTAYRPVWPEIERAYSEASGIRREMPSGFVHLAPDPVRGVPAPPQAGQATVYLYGRQEQFGFGRSRLDLGEGTPLVVVFGALPAGSLSYEQLRQQLGYLGTAPAGLSAGQQLEFEIQMLAKYERIIAEAR